MTAMIKGAKGGSSKPRTPKESPDSLVSIAYARLIDLISEGEIYGLVNGSASIYLDETPASTSGGSSFSGFSWEQRTGSQDQSYLAGFPQVENEINIGVEMQASAPWIRSVTNPDLSAVRINFAVPRLVKQNASNGDTTGYRVEYAIDVAVGMAAYQEVLKGAFDGKTSGGYERSVRIDLPAGAGGWRVRVRRLTPNSTTSTIADTVNIKSFTEIIDAKFRYPNSAIVGVSFDAETFGGSVPRRGYHARGRIIRVPSNYSPETRTYTGIWDGTFQLAYSNNPAWVYYDLLLHPRYGLGDRIDASQVDKWGLYQIGQYCDQLVSDGQGGMEPRFVCNLYLQKRADAYKALQDIAAVFRGITYWGAGQAIVSADMPADPVYTYTNANVKNGKFSYKGSKRSTRYSAVLVGWNDPSDMYRQKVEYVQDDDAIARFGVQTTEITALGCTSQGQAQRAGRWALLTNLLETETVTFSVGLDGIRARPGQIIRVADNARAGRRIGGRLSAATATVITVDKVEGVQSGDELTCILPSGVAQTRSIVAVDGHQLTVAPAFDAAPVAQSVWAWESTSLAAQRYRIVSIAESGPLEYAITASKYVEGKHAAVDSGAIISQRPITAIPSSVQAAPTNIRAISDWMIEQTMAVTTMTILWDAAPGATRYDVEWKRGDGAWVYAGRVGGTEIDVVGIYAGTYQIRVRALNSLDVTSPWGYSEAIDLAGKAGTPPAVAFLNAVPEVFGIRLEWGFPAGAEDTLRTEIQYGSTQTEQDALHLGDYAYPANTHTMAGLSAGVTFWFRARLIDRSGNIGPWSGWVMGQSSADASVILEYITGQITESELGQHLTDRIDLIDGPATNPETVAGRVKAEADARVAAIQAEAVARANADAAEAKARQDGFVAEAQSRTAAILVESQARATAISTEKTERQAADENLSQRIDTVSASSAGNAAAIQQEATARADADSALSSRIDTTAATAAGNAAAITAEQTARANADSALSSRIDTVTATAATNAAAITAEQTARANADSALTQRVDSLQARSGLFDAVLNYGFDAGLEGWSATRLTLAVGGGVITATATGTSAYLNSPSNLAIDGKTATKVRMRITRRAGSGWLGYVTYVTANHGSVSAYRKIVADPGLAVGQSAIVEWDMAALTTGGTDWVDSTITRLHIWLTSTVDDVFEIDWIAVGKESPAASTAALLAEQQARAAGDTANAQAITAAESRITNAETQQAAQATALSGLTTRVSTVESTVSSNSSSITSLTNSVTTVDGKAVAAQQAAQDAATLAGSKGKVIVQSAAPATADRLAQNLWIDTTNNANTPKRWTGSAWAQVTDKVATDAAAAAANALSGLATKADASALQALDTRVTSAEGTISSQGQSITSLTNTVGTKNRTYRQAAAPTTGLTVGDLWVNTTAGQNNKLSRWNGTTWDDTTDPRIPAAATAEALNSLSNTVTQQGNTLTSQGQSITSLTNRVTSAESVNTAQAGAISSLDTRVTSTEGALSSQASRIDGISAQINPPLAGDMGWNAGATSVLAGVWSEQSARASEDMALGQRIDTVVAQVDRNAAAITAEQTARATADSALAQRVDTLSAKVDGDIAAALQSEATARANADGALSSRIDTVQATANGAAASVQTVSQAQATTDGKLQAMYSVKLGVTSNGQYYAAGMGLGIENTPQGMQSQVLFQADRFAVINVANGQISTPFVIQGGQVFINSAVIGDASITMAKIADSLQSTNYVANEQGWRLDKTGAFEINGMVAGQGRLKITNQLIEVFDSNDMRRVRLGIWA